MTKPSFAHSLPSPHASLRATTTSYPPPSAKLSSEKLPTTVMDYPAPRQNRPPRIAITASFLLIAVFVIWLLLPRTPLPVEDIIPIPVVSKVSRPHLSPRLSLSDTLLRLSSFLMAHP